MKANLTSQKQVLLVIALYTLILIPGCLKSQHSLDQFNWLIGDWQRVKEKPGRVSTETWIKNESGELEGLGLSIMNSDTVLNEKLTLFEKDNNIYYGALVNQNESIVLFKLTGSVDNKFIFENPDHDFPKMVTYEKTGENSLKASISGDGKVIDFLFERKKE